MWYSFTSAFFSLHETASIRIIRARIGLQHFILVSFVILKCKNTKNNCSFAVNPCELSNFILYPARSTMSALCQTNKVFIIQHFASVYAFPAPAVEANR
jgi:hypothetical protein